MEVIRDLQEAEYNGLLLDTRLLEQYRTDYDHRITQLDREMEELLGEDLNLSSGQQLSAALYGGSYDVDGVETITKTLKSGEVKEYTRKCKQTITIEGLGINPLPDSETKKEGVYKTDAETISQLKADTPAGKKFLTLYQERAKLSTMNKTFFNGLLERAGEDRYVHPTLNQTVTRTSRLSSSNPNGQNFPRGGTGPVKQAFITRY
jgi:DNA polymerase I-like protein with 3'-5' exonuclease and polymerase domains